MRQKSLLYNLLITPQTIKSHITILSALKSSDRQASIIPMNKNIKFSKPNIQEPIQELVSRIRKQKQLFVIQKEFQNKPYELVFSQIEKMEVYNLTLGLNYQQRILSIILNPTYVNLMILELAQNQICSIEALSFLQAPNLTTLGLSLNKIVSLQPIIKYKSCQLQSITLQFNELNSSQPLKTLSRTLLSQKSSHFQQLSLQSISKSHISSMLGKMIAPQKLTQKHKNQLNDLSYLIKLNPSYFQTVGVLRKTRIQQKKLMQCLKRKYQTWNYVNGVHKFIVTVYVSMQG